MDPGPAERVDSQVEKGGQQAPRRHDATPRHDTFTTGFTGFTSFQFIQNCPGPPKKLKTALLEKLLAKLSWGTDVLLDRLHCTPRKYFLNNNKFVFFDLYFL